MSVLRVRMGHSLSLVADSLYPGAGPQKTTIYDRREILRLDATKLGQATNIYAQYLGPMMYGFGRPRRSYNRLAKLGQDMANKAWYNSQYCG